MGLNGLKGGFGGGHGQPASILSLSKRFPKVPKGSKKVPKGTREIRGPIYDWDSR